MDGNQLFAVAWLDCGGTDCCSAGPRRMPTGRWRASGRRLVGPFVASRFPAGRSGVAPRATGSCWRGGRPLPAAGASSRPAPAPPFRPRMRFCRWWRDEAQQPRLHDQRGQASRLVVSTRTRSRRQLAAGRRWDRASRAWATPEAAAPRRGRSGPQRDGVPEHLIAARWRPPRSCPSASKQSETWPCSLARWRPPSGPARRSSCGVK